MPPRRSGPAREAPPLRLWLVDDTAEHHDTAESTLAGLPGVSFAGFLDADEAIAAYARLARRAPAELPRVVLMDFYLGGTHGDAVTRELRRLEPAGSPLTIVGYSSVASGSARIVEAGGDVVVRKVRDASGRNPLLAAWLAAFRRGLG